MPTVNLFDNVVRFREVNADKAIYNLDGHTIEMARTVTVTSELPVPRKGNPGTLKTFLNIHRKVVLDAGTDSERIAPTVAKVEISLPLGTSMADKQALLQDIGSLTGLVSDPAEDLPIWKLLYQGILPTGA